MKVSWIILTINSENSNNYCTNFDVEDKSIHLYNCLSKALVIIVLRSLCVQTNIQNTIEVVSTRLQLIMAVLCVLDIDNHFILKQGGFVVSLHASVVAYVPDFYRCLTLTCKFDKLDLIFFARFM